METVYEFVWYSWDSCHSDYDSLSLHGTIEGAKKKLLDLLSTNEDMELSYDKDTGWPELMLRQGQYDYDKYFIQERKLED